MNWQLILSLFTKIKENDKWRPHADEAVGALMGTSVQPHTR